MAIFLNDQPKKSWAILGANSPFNRITLRAEKAIRVIYGKSWGILDVNSPFNRITLRAEKALRVTSSSGIFTDTFARNTPTQRFETLSIYSCLATAIFFSESVIIPDLDPDRSRAVEFSWTSRSQNLKL